MSIAPSTPFRSRSRRYRQIAELSPIVELWVLRLLVQLNAQREFIQQHGFSNDTLAELLGLEKWIDPSPIDFDPKKVRIELRKKFEQAEKNIANAVPPTTLVENILRLAALVGLSQTDCRILELAVMLHSERLLDDTADWLGALSSIKVCHALSVLIKVSENEIRDSLSAQGLLARSGLVSVDRNGSSSLRSKLDLLSNSFADMILSTTDDPVTLLRETVLPSSPGELHIDDYPHIQKSLNILRPYLRRVIETRQCGVNVFIHGDPGTGKSQLVKALAAELHCELFEVASEDADGDPVNGERRFRAHRAAQSFFAQRKALLLFDEAEDVFNDGDSFFGRKSTAQTRKAWVNRMLEENPVPTLWLSNAIHCLDPAFIRRFDMVFELPVPPKSHRERIVQSACGDLIPLDSIVRIAEAEDLAPAIVTRAASVIRSIKNEIPLDQLSHSLEHLISNTLEAQQHAPLKKHNANRLPDYYSPHFINADSDLAVVCEGLVRTKSGRLCLYGPPGTGKTAFGRWLAEQLSQPILVKRASDLLSKWLGGTEENIARAFREAEENHSLLLIDEVDSFLQDRRGAQQSWEISGVNEMLTQMESFSGVFVASTNLMAGLDQAALRRFDLKVKFDFLRPEQGWMLLCEQCSTLGIAAPDMALKSHFRNLKNLTPGDFSTIARQHRFRPIKSAETLINTLVAECAMKEGSKMTMGFL